MVVSTNENQTGAGKAGLPFFDAKEQGGRWELVSVRKAIGFCVGVCLFFVLVLKSEAGFFPGLDFANLLFHEAGHPILGLLSGRLEVYGGTIGQLAFPVALMISFWRKGHAISFAVAWIWFFENWLNIARYMADSRELVLPLVGGGHHDWNEIFARWQVLSYDTTIAAIVRGIGWSGMVLAAVWILWRGIRDYQKYGAGSGSGPARESGVS